jgi:hypothetical protein
MGWYLYAFIQLAYFLVCDMICLLARPRNHRPPIEHVVV